MEKKLKVKHSFSYKTLSFRITSVSVMDSIFASSAKVRYRITTDKGESCMHYVYIKYNYYTNSINIKEFEEAVKEFFKDYFK